MRGLRNKLKDQSGASILLALLFFLLCCMVGASVLMAAVSNAGKLRSNREEQQKYLLLSSALRLVCDELTSAETKYKGKYVTTKCYRTETIDGEEKQVFDHYEYEQKEGTFECELNGVLPLLPELDYLFAETFKKGGSYYTPLAGAYISAPAEHKLSLTVDVSEVEGVAETVNIQLEMDTDYSIRLTATLGNADSNDYIYSMKALLIGKGDLVLTSDEGEHETKPVTWTLSWIAKKEAGDVT